MIQFLCFEMDSYGRFGFQEDFLRLHSKMKFKDITSVLDLYILELVFEDY